MVYLTIKRNKISIHEVTGINFKNIVLNKEDLYNKVHWVWCNSHKVLERAQLIHGGGNKIIAVACGGRNRLTKRMRE